MSVYSNKQSRFKRYFKRKVFFSNELKKALLIAFIEAKHHKIYVTNELILYGILSQPNSISERLLSPIFSESIDKSLTRYNITYKLSYLLKEMNNQNFAEKFGFNITKPNKFYSEFWNENATTPWLSPEVKEVLRAATRSLLKSKKQINILTTKEILFELLNKESIRELLEKIYILYNT